MITHIRYLSNAIPLCEDPERIENPRAFVVSDSSPKQGKTIYMHCYECSAILMAYNSKSYEAELIEMKNERMNAPRKHFSSERAAYFTGAIAGLICGAILVLFVLWVFFG